MRLLNGERRPSAYELARSDVVDELAFVPRALAARAARASGESPEALVHELIREATARVPQQTAVTADDRTRALVLIRDMVRAGSSSYTIAAALNAEAVPSPHGRRWHRREVEALLVDAFALDEEPATPDHHSRAAG